MKKTHPLLVGIEGIQPYALMEGDELYRIEPPPMQIEGFLPAGGVMGITSYPGVGKTWLAMEVTRAVTSGTDFLGRYRAHRGGVLFVGSDSSVHDYARQWTRLTRHVPDAVDVFAPVRWLIQSTFMFEDFDEVRRLVRTHQTFEWGDYVEGEHGMAPEGAGFHVIVFDTLSRLTRANQNDNSQMEDVFRNVRLIAEATGAAVILLHHNSKKSEFNDGSDWRGAMSQIGALDSWVQLAPSARDKYLVGVQYKKFRGITPEDFAMRLNVQDPEVATVEASDEAVTREQRMKSGPLVDDIINHVRTVPGSRACDIRDALWPKYEAGVEVNGVVKFEFPSRAKFSVAINNRLTTLRGSNGPLRLALERGQSLYYLKDGEMKRENLTKLAQQLDPEDVEDKLDEEKQCRSTDTSVRRGTRGKSSVHSERVRKDRSAQRAVKRAVQSPLPSRPSSGAPAGRRSSTRKGKP